MAHLFALDQNFPEPIVLALQSYLEDAVELVPIRKVDERLPTFEDWQVLHALHAHPRRWEGLITTDQGILNLPKELAVLCQSKLSLIVAIASGHDPIRATGLVLAHISSICRQTEPEKAQVWRLRASAKAPEDPWQFMGTIAERQGELAATVYRREQLSPGALAQDPLA